MEIDIIPTKRSLVIEITIVISVLFHAVVWAGLTHLGTKPLSSSYLAQIVADPNARLLPTPAPTPADATPKPKPTPPPKNADLPPPNKEVKDVDPNEKPKPIFGVTEESVVDDSNFAVRVGNTLMKGQEKEFTDPSKVHPYAGGAPKAIKVSVPPKLRKMVPPVYPELAKQAGREGRVVLKVQISKNGNVVSASVVKADPPGMGFEQSAMDAIKEWLYSPPSEGVDVWCYQPIRFNLEG
jgi:periplasmic protein TonB